MCAKNVIVCCGPSGVGKSSLIKRLMGEFPKEFGFSVSHTTRSARPGEVCGKDYHFVDKALFETKIKSGEMVEYAHVHSNIYGTATESVQDVLKEGRKCILDIDVQGVDNVKLHPMDDQCRYIFVSPPSIEELEARLRSRGTETEEKIQIRLNNAKGEMEYKNKPDFWDKVLVNDDLEVAYTEFKGFMHSEA